MRIENSFFLFCISFSFKFCPVFLSSTALLSIRNPKSILLRCVLQRLFQVEPLHPLGQLGIVHGLDDPGWRSNSNSRPSRIISMISGSLRRATIFGMFA